MVRKGWTKLEVPMAASDSWQASTVRAVATCRISAACSSDWEVSTGVDETRHRQGRRQPAASQNVPPGSIEGSTANERTMRSGIHCSPLWRRPKRQAEMPSMEQQIHATEEHLAERRNASCNDVRLVGQGDPLMPLLFFHWNTVHLHKVLTEAFSRHAGIQ